jgi:hypothetical protein
MFKINLWTNVPIVLLVMALVVPSAIAEEKLPEVLAEAWVMVPMQGKSADLDMNIKKHVAHRAELADPRQWNLYSPVFGDNLNVVIARSFGFTWADMDTYRDWNIQKKPAEHFNEFVQPTTQNIEHYLSVIDMANSHWGPDVEYKYVGVSSYRVKMGHQGAMQEDIKLFSDVAKSSNWPYNWSWAQSVTGKGTYSLAVPYKNWAAMAPPEQKFSEMMAKHLGSEEKAKEVFDRWQSHFDSITYDVYALRSDLMP